MSDTIPKTARDRMKAQAIKRREVAQKQLNNWTFEALPDASALVGLISRAVELHDAGAVVGADLVRDIAGAAMRLDASEAFGVVLPLQVTYDRLPPEARDMRSRLQAVMRTCHETNERHTLTDAEADRLRAVADQLAKVEGEVKAIPDGGEGDDTQAGTPDDLPPAERKALSQYDEYAPKVRELLGKHGESREPKDTEVYRLAEHELAEQEMRHELAKTFEAWSAALTRARRKTGRNKYGRRAGREAESGSVVRRSQI